MARDDFTYVNLENALIEVVDEAIATVKHRGIPKYTSRKDFAVKAIQAQLDRDGIKEKGVVA